jgi:hypothetical protein
LFLAAACGHAAAIWEFAPEDILGYVGI